MATFTTALDKMVNMRKHVTAFVKDNGCTIRIRRFFKCYLYSKLEELLQQFLICTKSRDENYDLLSTVFSLHR